MCVINCPLSLAFLLYSDDIQKTEQLLSWRIFFAVRSIPVLYQEICKQLKGHLKSHMFIQSICIPQEIEEENVNDNKLISINFIIKKTLHVSFFFILLFFLHFICMGILSTCMPVYHIHAWYPLKTVKDISVP